MPKFARNILISFALALTATGLRAQIVFEPAAWDFGTIRETDGRVSHTFRGTNRGTKPVVLLDVVASCGCTVPEFSKRPLLPGEETFVKVTFDPAGRPGAFDKELGVYSSERRKIATLAIRGHVEPRPKSLEELYPVDAGGGLRLGQTLCALSYLYPGAVKQASVGFANTSEKALLLELRPRTESGVVEARYPQRIEPGERGEINFIARIPAAQPRYGTLRDVMEVRVDGRTDGTLLTVHAIGVDAPPKQGAPRPVSELSENILKFGTVKRGDAPLRRTFALRNAGTAPLVVRAVEHDGRIATSLAPQTRIAPGERLEVAVTLDPARTEFGPANAFLVIVTNDPNRPMRRLRITAIVEE